MTAHVAGCRIEDEDHDGICRDATSKPRVVLPDGKTVRSYLRASSHGDALDDKNGLIPWSQANAVRGVLADQDLAAEFRAADDGWVTTTAKTATKTVIRKASLVGGAEHKANTGTNLHAWTEMLDRGEPLVGLPPEHEADLMAYEYVTETMEHLLIEEFCVVDDYKIGGSFDRLTRWAEHPCPECGLTEYIFDVKTGSVGFPHKMAVQLADYSRSALYEQAEIDDVAYGLRTPLPPVCQHRAIILHLPAGEGAATPLWLDIQAGWDQVTGNCPGGIPGVKAWRARKDLLTPVTA